MKTHRIISRNVELAALLRVCHTGFSQHSLEFNPRAVHMGSVVAEVTLGQVSLQASQFSVPIIIPP
jgi:hypothetical protein